MSIYHNGKEYGATKVINYSASPDYNRGVTVDNIQTGNYQAADNGFLMIQLQSQQSNPTKVSVVRSKTPITDTGTEIASIVLSQYQYSETLTAQVMARDYYKLVIEGVGNPQVISCMFYPYASTVPIKLTEDISIEQVEGLESELDGKQDKGDYATSSELTQGLAGKQDKGNYFNKDTDKINLAKQVTGTLASANIADNAVTDAKFSGQLSIAKGGTGTKNGWYWKNSINKAELKAIAGIDSGTTRDFLLKLPNGNLVITSSYISSADITDLPVAGKYILLISDCGDGNANYVTAYRGAAGFETYKYNLQYNTWIKTRNRDGTIPAEIISPTVLKYTNSDGTWTETKLTTGEVMLEGFGCLVLKGSKEIRIPKYISTDSSIQVTGTAHSFFTAGITYNNTIKIDGSPTNTDTCYWYFRGTVV